jgi:hypothetical protein
MRNIMSNHGEAIAALTCIRLSAHVWIYIMTLGSPRRYKACLRHNCMYEKSTLYVYGGLPYILRNIDRDDGE